MDLDALAAQFGGSAVSTAQPAPPQQGALPWAANLSRQDQAKIQKDMYEEGRKRLADLQASIANSGQTMDDLNEFGRLNRENSTGSMWQQITPDKPLFRSGPSMEMAAIQARLAPAQRTPGAGASSDRDVALFLRGVPSLENDGDTNKGIREDFERKYSAALEKAAAMEQYLQQKGNLMDFDSQWAKQRQQAATPKTAPSASAAPTMRWNPQTKRLEPVR